MGRTLADTDLNRDAALHPMGVAHGQRGQRSDGVEFPTGSKGGMAGGWGAVVTRACPGGQAAAAAVRDIGRGDHTAADAGAHETGSNGKAPDGMALIGGNGDTDR